MWTELQPQDGIEWSLQSTTLKLRMFFLKQFQGLFKKTALLKKSLPFPQPQFTILSYHTACNNFKHHAVSGWSQFPFQASIKRFQAPAAQLIN